MNLSAWAYTGTCVLRDAQRRCKCHRVLKLARTIADLAGSERIQPARTIADLAGSERIQPAHIAEAIHLRSAAQTRVTRALIHRQSETTTP
jgi:predicted ATPase with chaperone activity